MLDKKDDLNGYGDIWSNVDMNILKSIEENPSLLKVTFAMSILI